MCGLARGTGTAFRYRRPVEEGAGPTNAIVVVGHGSATVSPDSALLELGLETRAGSAGEALAELTLRADAVLAAARTRGMDGADLQTRGISLYPQMDSESRRVVAYVASYELSLRLLALEEAAGVVDAVSEAAGDALRLGGLSLGTSETGLARAEAGARAVEDARSRAEALAAAGGVRVGRVLSIAEGSAGLAAPGPKVPYRAAAASSAAVPVEGGSAKVTASVTVTFELLD